MSIFAWSFPGQFFKGLHKVGNVREAYRGHNFLHRIVAGTKQVHSQIHAVLYQKMMGGAAGMLLENSI